MFPLNFFRDNASTSVIQPLQTDTLQSEVAADWIRPPPSPPISPALSRQFGQASTSKIISNSNENRDDHGDPLAQFYGKARAQQKLKEDGVSVNHCLRLLLINILPMKWSSVGELDIDDSDGGETDNDLENDLPHPIPKRVRSKVYLSRRIMVSNAEVQTFKGWTCDKKEVQRTTDCPNQDIIDKVNDLQFNKIWNAHALPSGFSLLNSWDFTSRN